MLNSRELAVLIWGFVFIVFMLVKKDIRHSLYGVIKALLRVLFNPLGILTMLYIGLAFFIMYLLKIINGELIKDYFVWIIFGLFPLIFKMETDYKAASLSMVVLSIFEFSIIPVFIINEYTLPLWAELILVPFVTLVSMMIVVAGMDDKYRQVHKLFNFILGTCSIIIIFFATKGFFLHLSDVKQIVFWEKMFMDLIGISLHIPLLYLVQALSFYEQIIIRTSFGSKRDRFFALFSIFKHCQFNKNKLANAQKYISYGNSKTVKQFSQSLSNAQGSEL